MTGMVAKGLAVLLAVLVGGTAVTGFASAESYDVMAHVELETGTTDGFDGGGDYVALNMTKNGTAAFFGVVYGTEANPNFVYIVSLYPQYFGGAEIRDENGGIMMHATPIPVITVQAQALAFLIEFNDTGFLTWDGREGAGNGLFDFRRSGTGMEDFDLTATEPIYKAIELKRAWERSEIVELETPGSDNQKAWEFSVFAEDVPYTRIWDHAAATNEDGSRNGTAADGVVERIEFIFHVGVRVTEENVQVPWYRVTLNADNQVIGSEETGTEEYKGVGLDSHFKYDHLIEGWDYTARSESSRLMLETFVLFGSFVPDLVQSWIDFEYGADYMDDFEIAEIETHTGGPADIAGVDDIPDEATLLTKDTIVFRDKWRKTGEMSWVNEVEIDGKMDEMVFQIHAGSVDFDTRDWTDNGEFHGAILLGGYIYPAGATIFHDPTFSASALLIDLPFSVAIPGWVALGLAVGAAVAVVAVLGIAVRTRGRDGVIVPPNYGAF